MNHAASEKDPQRRTGAREVELSADDYPELDFLKRKQAPAAPVQPVDPVADLHSVIMQGHLRGLDGARMGVLFETLLRGQLPDLLDKVVAQIVEALESRAPDDRRWALEGVKGLLTVEDLGLVPVDKMSTLLDGLVRMLVKEERVELRDAALEGAAWLLGVEAMRGELENVHAQLAWLERTARGRGAEYCERIMASRHLVLPLLKRYLSEGNAILESHILPFFRFVGDPGARTLMQLLDEESNRQHRVRILELLKRMGPLCVPALTAGLVAGSWHLVRNALNLVGDLEEPEAFEYVVPCLDHSDPRVVQAAIRALWKTGGKRAERYYLDLLPRADAETQCHLLDGLALISATGAIPAIGRLGASPSQPVRIKALETLGQLGHDAAIPVLEQQLKRKGRIFKTAEPMPIRIAAARALARLGTPGARKVLEEALADEPKGQDLDALRSASTAGFSRA